MATCLPNDETKLQLPLTNMFHMLVALRWFVHTIQVYLSISSLLVLIGHAFAKFGSPEIAGQEASKLETELRRAHRLIERNRSLRGARACAAFPPRPETPPTGARDRCPYLLDRLLVHDWSVGVRVASISRIDVPAGYTSQSSTLYTRDTIVCCEQERPLYSTVQRQLTLLPPAYYSLIVKRGVSKQREANRLSCLCMSNARGALSHDVEGSRVAVGIAAVNTVPRPDPGQTTRLVSEDEDLRPSVVERARMCGRARLVLWVWPPVALILAFLH
ncbi:hypothetical protein PR048_000830 [Dryococelus australis]|uniref:Uncharacterized protein n=1 Tax=Dryococelus australis TaxID=614101 RepID=A0ABQ9IFQ8_9NEOP|nr:hypothetical protein PR048_000830 [Dryococelus australis]